MQTVYGYITNIVNPNFSGIATVHVRTKRFPTKRDVPSTDERMVRLGYATYDVGEVHTFMTESGYGIRHLSRMFDGFSETGQHIPATFTIDDMGLLVDVEVDEWADA